MEGSRRVKGWWQGGGGGGQRGIGERGVGTNSGRQFQELSVSVMIAHVINSAGDNRYNFSKSLHFGPIGQVCLRALAKT